MINRELQGNQAAHDVLNKIVRAQLELLRDELLSYVGPPAGEGAAKPLVMPHQYGSIDSYDDLRNANDTALALLEKLREAMFGADPEKLLAELREQFTEVFFGCTIADGVEELLGVDWVAAITKKEGG